jgi:hypothetical protein
MNQKQREMRDQISAEAAIQTALCCGKVVAIAVDDWPKAERMLQRVQDIAEEKRYPMGPAVKKQPVIKATFGAGEVRIVAMFSQETLQ